MDLDDLKDVKRSFSIQVATRGKRTDASPDEARTMIVGALHTLQRASGARVKTLNADLKGKKIAIVFIENARFGENSLGYTTLDEPE